jgi:DNA-binding NarL/FixJ family response regulator
MQSKEMRAMTEAAVALWRGKLPVRIFLADDEDDVYQLLTDVFQGSPSFEMVYHARTPEKTRANLRAASAELLLLDIYFRGSTTGLELISDVRKIQPSIKILAMTGKGTEHEAESLFHKANGFLAKPFSPLEVLFTAIGTVLSGKLYYDAAILNELPAPLQPPYFPLLRLPEDISGDDRAYIHSVMRGKSDAQIAEEFGVKIESIYQKRSRICQRLGLEGDLERFLFRQLSGGGRAKEATATATP